MSHADASTSNLSLPKRECWQRSFWTSYNFRFSASVECCAGALKDRFDLPSLLLVEFIRDTQKRGVMAALLFLSLHPKKKKIKKNLWGFPSHLSAHVWMHLFHTVCKYDVCLLGCLVIRQPAESESGSKLGYPSSQGEKNTLRRIWRAKSLDDAPWLISDAQPVRDHKPNQWCSFVTRNNLKDLQFFAPTAYDIGAWSSVWYYANFTLSTFSDNNIKCF